MPADAPRAFFDSNVLLYLISSDKDKVSRVEDHLMNRGLISVQVLNEFTNIARRKHGLDVVQIRPLLEDLRGVLDVTPVTMEIHEIGLDLIERHGFTTYDAMIVAAALANGCGVLLSEDMQNGMQVYGRLRIANPFV